MPITSRDARAHRSRRVPPISQPRDRRARIGDLMRDLRLRHGGFYRHFGSKRACRRSIRGGPQGVGQSRRRGDCEGAAWRRTAGADRRVPRPWPLRGCRRRMSRCRVSVRGGTTTARIAGTVFAGDTSAHRPDGAIRTGPHGRGAPSEDDCTLHGDGGHADGRSGIHGRAGPTDHSRRREEFYRAAVKA